MRVWKWLVIFGMLLIFAAIFVAASTVHAESGDAALPAITLTDLEKLQVENASKDIDLLALRIQLAQRDLQDAQAKGNALMGSLAAKYKISSDAYLFDPVKMSFVPKPGESK